MICWSAAESERVMERLEHSKRRTIVEWASLLPPLAVLAAVALLWSVAPSQLELATRAALHGLCAQRPSHSFWFGPYQLPFDARMTGIYAGAAATVAWLARRAARRSAAPPSPLAIGFLATGVVILAVDGLNSLALDLGLRSLYSPHNLLRYATGAWTGVALGSMLWWVFQSTSWRPDLRSSGTVFHLGSDAIPLTAVLALFGWFVWWGPVFWFPLVAVGLVLAALLTLALLAWPVVLALISRIECATTWQELRRPALAALTIALAFMVVTSVARYGLERMLGLSSLT
jgi:uncharacterized membrane protein